MLTRGREARARASPDTVLSPLPRCFVRAVFLLLPADTRLRCCEVSRAWQALLADRSFWLRLNLSIDSGIARFSEALLHAAVAKAGGQLRALDFTAQALDLTEEPMEYDTVVRCLGQIVAANAATLTELRVVTNVYWHDEDVRPAACGGSWVAAP